MSFIKISTALLLTWISIAVHAGTPFKPCEHAIQAPLELWSSGWSREYSQQRTYDEAQAGLVAADLPSLQVAWSFAFEKTTQPRSLPAITAQALFIGSEEGAIYALDTQTGCGYWRYQADDMVRTAISVGEVDGRWLVFFGDNTASAYAVDALSGQLVWKTKLDHLPLSVITGSPVLYQQSLLVPVASWSVGLAANPLHGCCQFRGQLASLNAATGEIHWRHYTIPDVPTRTYRNALGIWQYGPSGAGVWSAPTIDEKRQRIYIGTGQNYSSPSNDTSDAILALDLYTGKKVWSKQVLPKDAWNVACPFFGLNINCPKEKGPDYDFGAPPILMTRADGKDIILGGSKSGMVYAFDPDNSGEILWERRVGRGGVLGGVHWGMAATAEHLYVPIADTDAPMLQVTPGEAKPGLNKLDIRNGETLWRASTQDFCTDKKKCRGGLSAAVTGVPEAVFAPGLDGILRAYAVDDGSVLWQFDSTQSTVGVNGVKGHGGTLDVGGVVVSHGMVFFNSGYGGMISSGGNAGNVFWVLKKSTP